MVNNCSIYLIAFIMILMYSLTSAPITRASYIEGYFVKDTWDSSSTGYTSRRFFVKDTNNNLFVGLIVSTNHDNQVPYHVSIAKLPYNSSTWDYIADPGITSIDANKGIVLAIDSGNNLHVAWHAWESSELGQFYYKSFNGSAWSAAEQVSTTAENGGRSPVIAVDSQNNIHVVWQNEAGSSTYYRKKSSGSWSAITDLGGLGAQSSLAIDYNNDVHVVGGYAGALLYRKCTGGVWGAVETIDNVGYPRHASIAVDSSSQPHVAYTGDGYELGWKIFYAVRISGVWQTRVQISTSDYNHHDPTIALDSEDTVYLIYNRVIDSQGTQIALCYRKKTLGSWIPETLLTDPSLKAYSAQLRWSAWPATNRVLNESSLDFVWTTPGTGSPLPYPVKYYHGVTVQPTYTPTYGPSFTPTLTPTITPTMNVYMIDATTEVLLQNQTGFRISIADVNGDLFPDILFHEPMNEASSNPNDVLNKQKLFLNVPGATPGSRKFIDFTAESGIHTNRQGTGEGRHSSLGAFADVDNDGDLDLFLGLYYHRLETYTDWGDRNDLYLNDGAGHFTLSPDQTFYNAGLINTSGATFIDYDLDGWVDLYVGTWFLDYANSIYSLDRLYHNDGDGTFTDVTTLVGMNQLQPSYGVTAVDYNKDMYPDLFAANYCREAGFHWRNNGNGTFTEIGATSHYSEFVRCSWGCMPRDYDNDGDIDLFEVFVHGSEYGERSGLMVNYSNVFTWEFDRVIGRGAEDPDPGHHGDHYGSWFDVDNDGLPDFVITECGYSNNRIYFLKQHSDHYLYAATSQCGLDLINASGMPPHNASPFDYDLDGDEDLIVGIAGEAHVYCMKNVVGASNHWISIRLIGQGTSGHSNKAAIGARIEVVAGGTTYTQIVDAGNGHFAPQTPLIKTFGLGSSTLISSIVVHWSNSLHSTTTLTNVNVDQLLTIYEAPPVPPPIPALSLTGVLLLVLAVSGLLAIKNRC